MNLLDLPQEVIRIISTHLDPPSATSLSLTCHQLQEPAESNLWYHISLTQSDIAEEVSGLRPIQDWGTVANARAGRTVTRRALGYLKGARWRSGMVRVLEQDVRRDIPGEVGAMFDAVAGGLEDLKLRSGPPKSIASHMVGFTTMYGLFSSLTKPLVSLRRVSLDVQEYWDGTVIALLQIAPNLRSLRVRTHGAYVANFDSAATPYQIVVASLPKLEEFIVDGIIPSINLPAIITQAPNLRYVAIRKVAGLLKWQPSTDNRLLVALSKLQDLQKLEVPSACLGMIEMGGFERVEGLTVEWDTERFEDDLSRNLIPRLPSIQSYLLEIPHFTPRVHQNFNDMVGYLGVERPQQVAMRLLSESILSKIQQAPNLAVIRCHDQMYVPIEGSLSTSGKLGWREASFHGLVIYTYTNGVHEKLTHVRIRLRDHQDCIRHRCEVCVLKWQDKVEWNGRSVPREVLQAVYAASGIDADKMEPGRDLGLPTIGWEVLRCWDMQQF